MKLLQYGKQVKIIYNKNIIVEQRINYFKEKVTSDLSYIGSIDLLSNINYLI